MPSNVMGYPEVTTVTSIDWFYVVNDGTSDARIRATNLPVTPDQQTALNLKANLQSPTLTTPTLNSPTIVTPTINVTADAIGDVYFRNASGLFTRLAIGTTGQVLTVAAGLPSWAASAGGGGGVGLADSPLWTGSHTWSKNSVASTPTLSVTGTWFTGGTGTTTKPHVLIETAGAASTTWSTAGTGLAVNAATGFAGNLIDLRLNGVSRFTLTAAGLATFNNLSLTLGSDATGDIFYRNSGGTFARRAIGTEGQFLAVVSGLPAWTTGIITVHGRGGPAVTAQPGDYIWSQITKTTSSIADIATRNISDTTGTLAVARGGTGLASISIGRLLYASATDVLASLTLGTNLSITNGILNAAVSSSTIASSILSVATLPAMSVAGEIRYLNTVEEFWVGIATPAGAWAQLYTANVLIDGGKLLHSVNLQTGTTFTFVANNRGQLVTGTNGAATAYTLPQAGATFPDGWYVDVQNRGVGTITITPTVSTIDGASSLALTTNQGMRIFSNGTNYFTQRGVGGGGGGGVALGDNPAWTGAHTWSRSSLASSPTLAITGTWFTGGTSTTTKPHVLIEPAGTPSTAWYTTGTGLGINAVSGFIGNLLDLQVNGVSKFRVYATGELFTVDTSVMAKEIKLQELVVNGSNYISWLAPDAITTTLQMRFPDALPTAGQIMQFSAPASGISTISWTSASTVTRFAKTFFPLSNEPPATNFARQGRRNGHPVLLFNDTTQETAIWTFEMPAGYAGGNLEVYIVWAAATATTGNGAWDVSFERVNWGGQDLDADGFATALAIAAVNVSGTSGVTSRSTLTGITNAQADLIAENEPFRIRIRRDVATDTAVGDLQLVSVALRGF